MRARWGAMLLPRACSALRSSAIGVLQPRRRLCGLGVAPSVEEIQVRKLYRDCLKLSYHIAARSAKGDAMRQMVRSAFKAQMHVTDIAEINRLKMLAVQGLQNYVIHESTKKAVAKKRDGEE